MFCRLDFSCIALRLKKKRRFLSAVLPSNEDASKGGMTQMLLAWYANFFSARI